MQSHEPGSAYFETTLTAMGNNTGIVVPDGVIDQLGAGKRPAVMVEVNGYEYRSSVAVMGGRYLISLTQQYARPPDWPAVTRSAWP